jgi:predicted transcriptional regulator
MTDDKKWVGFQPHKEDLTKVLGDLESTVMKSVWALGSGDVKAIQKHVNAEKKVATTTVATILDILHSKGLVERELFRSPAIKYVYRPALTRKEFESTVVKDVFKGLFESFSETTVSYLISNSGIEDKNKQEEFRKYLEKIKDEAS